MKDDRFGGHPPYKTGEDHRRHGEPYLPAEFRAQAVELSYLPGKTVIGVARDLGVNPKTMHFWRHLARKNGTVPGYQTQGLVDFIGRDFAPERPGQVLYTDITYIATEEDGWAYLVLFTDSCSRRIVS